MGQGKGGIRNPAIQFTVMLLLRIRLFILYMAVLFPFS